MGEVSLDWMQAGAYLLQISGLGLLAGTLFTSSRRRPALFAGFMTAVLLFKVPVVSRQLSLEAVLGAAAGLVVVRAFWHVQHKMTSLVAAAALLGSVTTDSLRAVPGEALSAFSWIPFRAHMVNDLVGIGDILAGIWPYVALSYLTLMVRRGSRRLTTVFGGLSLFAFALVLEWNQQSVPGRAGDITDAVLALVGWTLPLLHPSLRSGSHKPVGETHLEAADELKWTLRAKMLFIGSVLFIFAAMGTWFMKGQEIEHPLDESTWHKLPPPSELPPVTLAAFHYAHPRLPAPSVQDIVQLQRENPGYFRQHKRRARGGQGDFHSVTLSAFVDPGSQDLALLYGRLMELKFSWRGHQQTKPLAVAYDWLYDQWSEAQRAGLREKLAQGIDYLIFRIREKERLSPYNVYLYNSPFQALVASTLALYGDHPRSELAMRFTYDYWKNRVLPVWRQIMGRNGGWHEGGEYVGIGIGQAIYQVPAMWRKATGEDLFSGEPGIRGFLDFLIYRTRPDRTCFRWGDAGGFTRSVPDRIPLAIEYGHEAAYSLERCANRLEPTSWPWGPLPNPELCHPEAVTRLPLARHFDGIGLVVARSDWTPDATYVTFKAGDNFWSHSHLDQGAFTIYKGGALAIDSGLYFDYGCDHHMNYTYQTVAHNTVTVTDPEDMVPAPRKQEDRLIANDGGQRRIGSGWGVEAAPLDLEEWERKRAIYHTGTTEKVFMEDDLVVAVADVTPAYTNELSGKGTFSHRTKRVELFWRTFGYDRLDDVIVIFDRVKSTHPEFQKRWLLHSIERPAVSEDTFRLTIPPTDEAGHRGGTLYGTVLLPREAIIDTKGGKGEAFLVDGSNFDEQGKVTEVAARKKRAEPGGWRIEVRPPVGSEEDFFLTVLLPTPIGIRPTHQVRLIGQNGQIGCQISGSHRTTHWHFSPEQNGVAVEVQEGARTVSFELTP